MIGRDPGESPEQAAERLGLGALDDGAPNEAQRPNGENVERSPPAFTDEALALAFAERHADDLRYVAAWGRWLSWTGTHWRCDDTLEAFDLARPICRQAAASCNDPKVAREIASVKTVTAVEKLAKADRRMAATVEQWNAAPWLFNAGDDNG